MGEYISPMDPVGYSTSHMFHVPSNDYGLKTSVCVCVLESKLALFYYGRDGLINLVVWVCVPIQKGFW